MARGKPWRMSMHFIRSISLGLFLCTVASAQPLPWLLQSPGTTNWQINDMAFTSPDRGFFCGSNEELWETTDCGQTWTNRIRFAGFGVDGNQFYSIGFFDSMRGFLISNADQPAKYTTNGGQTWQVATGVPYGREHFDIVSPTQAFLGGWQFSTTNAGTSWSMSPVNPLAVNLGRIFSFDMRDTQVGLMASETYNPPIVAGTYRTTDGGQTWNRFADWGMVLWLPDGTALNARPYPLPEFLPLPLFDRGAEIFRSTDAGLTWELIADHVAPGLLDQAQGFWDWVALDASTVVGVTLSGKVWRSNDAGVTWTLTQPVDLIRGPVPNTAMGIRAIGSHVWVFGELGIMMRSDDAGQTWLFPASGVGADVNSISMRDDRVGLAAAGGFILRTTDGGQHWSPSRLNVEGIDDVLPPDRDYMEGYVQFSWVTPTTVYVFGGASNCCAGRFLMWKSTDAGLTWQYVYGL
ncbi:MAG: YCF48-related protein, partial [Vicinamibacterales bacterium]